MNPPPDYSKHQKKVIQRYYDNLDTILLQRLQEQVTNLYLAEGKKRETLWKQVRGTLEKLKLPESRVDHILEQRDVTLLAKLVEELFRKA